MSQFPDQRAVRLPNEFTTFYRFHAPNQEEKNSCLTLLFQVGLESVETNTIIDLFVQMIHDTTYEILRTKEQLGYIVWTTAFAVEGVRGVRITVQSPAADPLFLENRAEACLKVCEAFVREMSEEDFKKHRQAVIARIMEKDDHLAQESERYWDAILRNKKVMDTREMEVKHLESLHLGVVVNFMETYILKGAKERRKFVLQSFSSSQFFEDAGKIGPSHAHSPSTPSPPSPSSSPPSSPQLSSSLKTSNHLDDEERREIRDIWKWKRSQPLFPSIWYVEQDS